VKNYLFIILLNKIILHHNDEKILVQRNVDMMFDELKIVILRLKIINDISYV
jgi:hypothetical protein